MIGVRPTAPSSDHAQSSLHPRYNARAEPAAVVLGEEDVVILVAVERRVEVDQVNRLLLDVPAEDVEVVAVVQEVIRHALTFRKKIDRRRPWYGSEGGISSEARKLCL